MTAEKSPVVYQEFAEFYDIYVGDGPDDLPFYLEYAGAVSTPVLEIGAGSGRLTIPLARAGVSVVAVDVSPSMLAILNSRLAQEPAEVRRKIEVVSADAVGLALGKKYELIIVPFYTFNYFLTEQDAVMERFFMHLPKQGYLLIDVFIPWSRIEYCSPQPVLRVDTLDPETGNRVRGWNVYAIDKEHQMEFRKHVFEVTKPDGTVKRREFTTERRYFFPDELEALFAASGFSVEDVFTGYKRKKAQADSEQLLYVLRHG